jgi:hypothetical protein
MKSMRRAAFAVPLLLAMGISPALAENWRRMGTVGDSVGYVDRDSIKRSGDKVRFWRDVRSPEPQTAPTGDRFDSASVLIEVNCRTKTFRYLRQRAKLGGRVIYDAKDSDDSLQAMEPGSVIDTELRAVCFNDWPAGK